MGYLVDEGDQESLVFDLIEQSRSADHYSIDYLIVQTFAEDKCLFRRAYHFVKKHGLLKLVALIWFKAIIAVETRLFVRDRKLKSAFERHPLDALDVPRADVRPVKSKSGLVYRYRDDDLDTIKRLNVDLLLNGQGGILRGEILNVCEFGIVSFHHGNNDVNRGGPAGFWEVFNQEPSTGFVIQRLLDELDGGDVFMRGAIATKATYAQNLAQIYKKPTVFMHRFLEALGRTRTLPDVLPKSPYAYRLYTVPSLGEIAAYQVKTFSILTRKVFSLLGRKNYRWGVSYQYTEDWRSAVLWKSNIIKNPPYRFLADPFVLRHADMDVCFVEDFDFRTDRGKISVFKIDGERYEEMGPAIDEPFHMSYPFIFTVDNELYMCPETLAIREIRLYKCVEFPLRWTFYKTLIKGVSAVDTDIFYFKDRWWLLTTIDSSEIGEVCSELHLFHSDAFDADNWTPHPNNPVIFDSERARNGGLVREGDRLFRVFQRQGFDVYGESMGIAEIEALGAETYREQVMSVMGPRFLPKIIGTHTYAYDNGLLAVDFVKIERFKPAG
ncbi:glucosamine inositolphosphorylceramide transferase family protein [Mycobacterium alsense]|uniref:glucosamine inositolphosphorylceramide transferase family protein n=1 Tax=Mycobacterium alsense TaxID=324058 RepID=UPI0009EE07C0|nr:hypothetical protein [Mycobacterium alsense]